MLTGSKVYSTAAAKINVRIKNYVQWVIGNW
jgi:hypothetical protein